MVLVWIGIGTSYYSFFFFTVCKSKLWLPFSHSDGALHFNVLDKRGKLSSPSKKESQDDCISGPGLVKHFDQASKPKRCPVFIQGQKCNAPCGCFHTQLKDGQQESMQSLSTSCGKRMKMGGVTWKRRQRANETASKYSAFQGGILFWQSTGVLDRMPTLHPPWRRGSSA